MSTLKKLALTAAAVAVVAYRMKGSKNAPVATKARTPKAEPKTETMSEPVAAPVKKMSKSKTRRTKAKARAAKHAS